MFDIGKEVKVCRVDLPTTGASGLVTSIVHNDDITVITVQLGGKYPVQKIHADVTMNQEINTEK